VPKPVKKQSPAAIPYKTLPVSSDKGKKASIPIDSYKEATKKLSPMKIGVIAGAAAFVVTGFIIALTTPGNGNGIGNPPH